MPIDYKALADEKLRAAKLSGKRAFYIFFEAPPIFEAAGPAEEMMRRVFASLELSYCCNAPGIPLSNGKFGSSLFQVGSLKSSLPAMR